VVNEEDYQIVSPPFCCGATWLINALLALEIKVTNNGFKTGHWLKDGDDWLMGDNAKSHLKWHCPVLHEKEKFFFNERVEIVWEHRLDFIKRGRVPTILFVRDPRDAVYSLYKRNYEKDISFIRYLIKPDEWPDHFPGMFQLPPIETYNFFCSFWIAMSDDMPIKIVRFEDVKCHPRKVIKEVLDFLNITRDDDQIDKAIASSGFENAMHAMLKMEKDTGAVFKTARKGKVNEWKNVYNWLMRLLIRDSTKRMLSEFNYDRRISQDREAWIYSGDYRSFLSTVMDGKLYSLILSILNSIESGYIPPYVELIELIEKNRVRGERLLRFAMIMQATYYVNLLFDDLSSGAAKRALALFINLNMFYRKNRAVRVAALHCLERISAETEFCFDKNLGYRIRLERCLWEGIGAY